MIEILKVRKQVEDALSSLAKFSASKDFSIEYLLLVEKIMCVYHQYEKAIADENTNQILECAEQIVCTLEIFFKDNSYHTI